MSSSRVEIFKQALDLADEDRATLAGLLIESLEGGADEGVEEAWRLEVSRRVAELEAGTVEAISWETLKAKLQERLHGR